MTAVTALGRRAHEEAIVLDRARAGDRDAFAELLRRHDRGLRTLAYRLLGDRDRMDDALQEAYVRAFRALPRFRGDSSVATWLYRIAYNACLEELGRTRRVADDVRLDAVCEPADPSAPLEDTILLRSRLAGALAQLASEDRAAVLLVDAQGFDYRSAGGARDPGRHRRLAAQPSTGSAQAGARERPGRSWRMTENTSTHRNEALGAALRALEVPEHRPGFERELRRRLAEERLAGGGARRSSRRRPHVRVPGGRLAVAAAALGVVAVLAVPLLDRLPGLVRADVASAGEVRARVRASLGSLESLSGTLVAGCSERGCPAKTGERRWEFAVSSHGDLRVVGPTRRETITYDASTGVVRSAQRSASIGGETIFYAERRGVAPGPPDLGPPTWQILDEFGAFVRALLVAEDPRVHEIVYDGRPAWQLDVDAVPNAIVPEFTGDRFQLTVDRETGIPVRVVELKGGEPLRELRVEELAVDAELGSAVFRLPFPADVEVMRSDDGFRRVPLADVGSVVGYAPLVPASVPDGYELAEVAVAEQAGPTGREAGNPPSRMVVSLSYRRGFDQLVVTTRLASGASWTDPVATGEGYVDEPEAVAIGRGALAGARAELLIVPRGIPHLWTQHDGLVVTVAGALGRDELVRVTESLERRE